MFAFFSLDHCNPIVVDEMVPEFAERGGDHFETTCVATQVVLILDVFRCTSMLSNPQFRGKKWGFDGTVDPVVAGSSPVALA